METSTRPSWWIALAYGPMGYTRTRFVLIRALGFIYCVAFLSLYHQLLPLFGEHGLLPIQRHLTLPQGVSGFAAFLTNPSVFWFDASDLFLVRTCQVGLALSVAVLLGLTNALAMALLWFLYMSFVHVGQIFYGFGWEILLLEAGFLAIFTCPLSGVSPEGRPPSRLPFWLYRWLLFRVMFGAGLIKLRGDTCWRDLTCLIYHYETQPIPNPASWYLHQLPAWFHAVGVLVNHGVELIVPFGLLAPGRIRHFSCLILILFQGTLIVSGNLSFLNWLTIAVALGCLDDGFYRWWPREREKSAPSTGGALAALFVFTLVLYLSPGPALNLLSNHQVMNSSFDRLQLVNTYGAFGSVGRTRAEIILSGTTDPVPTDRTRWREYQFKAKPGDVHRRPPILSPYHLRIDWMIWFAAMSSPGGHPWFVHLIWKLLSGEPLVVSLLDGNPFGIEKPRWIKADLYEYHFTRADDVSGNWWTRRYLGSYLPPVSLESKDILSFLKQNELE